MPILEDFNPAKLLYYNPELVAFSNILTNTQAYEWAVSNDIQPGAQSNDDAIPESFNSEIFLSDYKRRLNASPLNAAIKAAMIAEGFTEDGLGARARYANTIYADSVMTSNNVMKFNPMPGRPEDMFYITSNVMSPGDKIKFTHKVTGVSEYATVATVWDSETFSISHPQKTFNGVGDVYTVIGIKLWDVERLARINFLRGLDPAPEVPPAEALIEVDTRFNADLYRLLYPEADKMSDIEAFSDYVNRRDNNELRIGKVADIPLDSNKFTPEFDFLTVNFRLNLDESAGLQWGDKYIYGISKDDVTHSSNLNKAQDHLISEWAMKKYVDRKFDVEAVFNNMVVNGSALFKGPVDFQGGFDLANLVVRSNATIGKDLTVHGQTFLQGGTQIAGDSNNIFNCTLCNSVFDGTSEFVSDVYVDRVLHVAGAAQASRFGIGPVGIQVIYDSNADGLYNAKVKNLECSEVLEVGNGLSPGSVAVNVNGFIQADNLNNISDKRLKFIKGTYTTRADPLDVLDAINPILFSYMDEPKVTKLGFLADEVERVLPEAIIKIKKYESQCDLDARLCNTTLMVKDFTCYQPGDELYLEPGHGWMRIEKVLDANTYTMSAKAAGVWVGKVTKARLDEVKTIDYLALLASMCGALKELRQHMRTRIC